MKRYVYFFTRQDLTPEQQLVQTAHVAYKIGSTLGRKAKANETIFVCIGVRDRDGLWAVMRILDEFSYAYECFGEPDLDVGITAVAVHPVNEDKRDILLAFNTLRFKQ